MERRSEGERDGERDGKRERERGREGREKEREKVELRGMESEGVEERVCGLHLSFSYRSVVFFHFVCFLRELVTCMASQGEGRTARVVTEFWGLAGMRDKVGNWGIHVKWMTQYFCGNGIKIGARVGVCVGEAVKEGGLKEIRYFFNFRVKLGSYLGFNHATVSKKIK